MLLVSDLAGAGAVPLAIILIYTSLVISLGRESCLLRLCSPSRSSAPLCPAIDVEGAPCFSVSPPLNPFAQSQFEAEQETVAVARRQREINSKVGLPAPKKEKAEQ